MTILGLGLTDEENEIITKMPDINRKEYSEAFKIIYEFINKIEYKDLFSNCVIDIVIEIVVIQRIKDRKIYI
ncbi:MAG: hypothetical protein ACYDD5_00310 [Sulfuricurvum sp.]